MHVNDVIIGLKILRESKQTSVFANPPQDYGEFQKRLGIWIGLTEALNWIEEARKKEENDPEF